MANGINSESWLSSACPIRSHYTKAYQTFRNIDHQTYRNYDCSGYGVYMSATLVFTLRTARQRHLVQSSPCNGSSISSEELAQLGLKTKISQSSKP